MTDEDRQLGLLAVATAVGGYVLLKAAIDDVLEPKASRRAREEHFLLKRPEGTRAASPLEEVIGFALVLTVSASMVVELAQQYAPTLTHT